MLTTVVSGIKKYGIPALLVLSIVFGINFYVGRRQALSQLTYTDGLYQQEVVNNAQIVSEKEREIKKLQEYIVVIDMENQALVKRVDNKTLQIRQVVKTQTELAEARKNLVNKDDIIYNQDLQIQEFYKERALNEQRFTDMKTAFLYERSAKEAAIAMAKEYYELWQAEKKMHQLSLDAYSAYKSQVARQQFKLTLKGIGERVLYAGLGYGLGRLSD